MIRILTIAQTVWLEVLRRKDVYVLLMLLTALLLALLSADVFGLGGVAGHVKELGLMFAWVFAWILSVTVSSRQLPHEEARGTIFPLLAKPISRSQVVVGKWLGAWSVVSVATFCFYALLWVVVLLRKGTFGAGVLFQGYLLHVSVLAVISAVGVAASARMNADAAATLSFAVTGGLFVVVPRIPELLTTLDTVTENILLLLYVLMPHLDLFDMRQLLVHEGTPAHWGVAFTIVAYGMLLTGFFLMLAWLGYRRKVFSRGEAL